MFNQKRDNLALTILESAIKLAEVLIVIKINLIDLIHFHIKIEERKSFAKKLAYAKCSYSKDGSKNNDAINNKIDSSDHQQRVVLQNNNDKARIGIRGSKTKSKKDTRDDKENTQNVIQALDSTIIPLR